VFYGKVEAVRGVDLKVNEGEFVTLIGPNGAGKTSILNAISGVVADKHGEIWFEGNRIDQLSAYDVARKGIIQVPEGRRVFPLLTVRENLKMGSSLYRDSKKEQEQLEVIFSLFPVLKQKLGQKAQNLSGGEQQMLAIGRALMACPRLLLLDEPSLGLSPLLTRIVAEQMMRINQAGIPILLVEQNARTALQLASRAYVMETGNLVVEGPSQQLQEDERVRRAYLAL
jgi:branched-chain amino acid transport system ATP-binding protein